MSPITYAYLLALISTLCWGVIVIPLKLAGISGVLGIGVSMLTGALAMTAFAGPEMLSVFSLPVGDLAMFPLAGTMQFFLGCMFYYESIRVGSVSIAVPVTRAKVILVLLFAILLGIEAFRWPLLWACVLVVVGGVLIGLRPKNAPPEEEGQNHRLSMVFAALSCLCWGCGETLIGLLTKDLGPVAKNGLMLWSGFIVYCLFMVVSGRWRGFLTVPLRGVLCYVSHGLVSFSIAYVFMVKAMDIAGPPRISCITSTYPLLSAVIGWMVFKERFSPAIGTGALLVVAGVIVLQFA